MNKKLKICLFFFLCVAKISVAQTSMNSLILNSKKIDFENLKRVAAQFGSSEYDIFSPIYDDCNSYGEGTTRDLRFCLNIQLQREDSLMRKALNDMIAGINDPSFIKKVKLTQEIWERYRYAYCSECVQDEQSKMDMFAFMRCATKLTIARREDIEQGCSY